MADAKPISLDDYRKRRSGWEAPPAPKPVKPVFIAAEPDRVLLRLSDGAELELSPEHAETWAERLAEMAKTARALGQEGGGDAG